MGSQSSSLRNPSGFRVLNVLKGSPAHLAGFEMFFDYIVEVDNHTFVRDYVINFSMFLQKYKNKTVKFVLFNGRYRAFRDVWVTPREWSKDGNCGLLGASINFVTNILECPPSVRVLHVYPNSPAAIAGLQALRDYLLGTETHEFATGSDVVAAIAANERIGKEDGLTLFVFNSKTESTRIVTLKPNISWGGTGYLGCDIGEGIFHRIPAPTNITHKNTYSRYINSSATTDENTTGLNDFSNEVYIESQPAVPLPVSPPKLNENETEKHTPETVTLNETRYTHASITGEPTYNYSTKVNSQANES